MEGCASLARSPPDFCDHHFRRPLRGPSSSQFPPRSRVNSSPPVRRCNLVFCSQDGRSRFVDKVLHVLIWPAKQIAFDNDRTVIDGLRTAFPDINTADGLLGGVGLSLRTGPTVEPVSRFHLDAEQKGLLADVQPGFRIGFDSKAADGAGIVDEQRKN